MLNVPNWNNIVELRHQLSRINLEYFLMDNLFSFSWWLLLITMLGLLILWLTILDRERTLEIVIYGLFIALTGTALDVIGVSFMLWGYPIKLVPSIPPIFEIHIGHTPFIYMIVYQLCKTWKSFFISMTITALLFAFIFEPLLVWLRIYELHNWKYVYSFPIYIFIGVFFRWVVIKLKQIDIHY